MNACISEFREDAARQAVAWNAPTGHVAVTQPELIVLPEMPVCEWIFVDGTVESVRWIVTANIDLALAEKRKSTYPRDLQRTYDM